MDVHWEGTIDLLSITAIHLDIWKNSCLLVQEDLFWVHGPSKYGVLESSMIMNARTTQDLWFLEVEEPAKYS